MNKVIPVLLGGYLLVAITACTNAKTSSDAPNTTASNGATPDATSVQNNQQDASNNVRKAQMEADIRAREQRNATGGDPLKRADADLESEVRTKLEANIPQGKLTVSAKDGVVTVAGTVPNQNQLTKIEPLAKQIKGVTGVAVKATVAPPKAN
ncbi:MAG: BON domain-containing protein [Scytolyngbya sp. HA4215-MV1]|nr:BON domain-containing protein [Scytolyngbya sp. HA4215-MV1]